MVRIRNFAEALPLTSNSVGVPFLHGTGRMPQHHDLQRQIQDRLRQVPRADWVQSMIDHFQRTGAYRPEDLRRLLGDPNRTVEVGPKSWLSSLFCTRNA